MSYRTCRNCNIEKELSEQFFYKRGSGFRRECKVCTLQKRKEYYPEIREDRAVYIRQYYKDNKEVIQEQNKEYISENQEKRTCYLHQYYQNNKKEIISKNNKRHKIRRQEDPAYRLRKDVSTIIGKWLKKNGGSKTGSSVLEYLSYSFLELKIHLEAQFEPWMNWQNQWKYKLKPWNDNDPTTWTWQIDHIIPQSSFDFADKKEIKKCWNLSNLRPYSAKLNVIEGSRKANG